MTMTKSICSGLIAVAFASIAGAQTPAAVSPGWSAYSGCWEPVVVEGQPVPAANSRVCVVPSGANGADLISFVDDKVTERTHIEADGRHHDVARQGCSGWEAASFSADGRRLYMESEQQCAAGLKRKASALFAMSSNGQWMHTVGVSADGTEGLRVARYTPVAVTSSFPSEIFNALDGRALADRTARVAAQARVTTDAIIESSKMLSSGVVGAWLAELDQTFTLDEKTLIRLADAGVSPVVIDVMVAVSNPKIFEVHPTGAGVSVSENELMRADRLASRDCTSPLLDPWGYYEYNPCDPYHRFGYYGSRRYGYGYGYNPYDPFRLNDQFGYGGLGGYGNYGYNGYSPVVIVVRGADNPEPGHGRMTKDGYKRDPSATGSTRTADRPAEPMTRTGTGDTQASRGTTSTGTTSTGTTSSGGNGGSSSGRTATRKPPAN